jgi:hypothetical protein
MLIKFENSYLPGAIKIVSPSEQLSKAFSMELSPEDILITLALLERCSVKKNNSNNIFFKTCLPYLLIIQNLNY